MIILFGLVILLLLALIGTPLFVIISGIAMLAFYMIDIDLSVVMVEMYRMATAPTLIAIPLFTFAGYVLAESNTPKRLTNLANALFGWMPGGLAVVAIVSSAFFTAFTGASGVTIIAIGGLLYPILLKERYPERFSLGLLTSSGSIGLLFPPSLPIILYGLVAKIDINKLFIAGVLPGILLITIVSSYCIKKGLYEQVPKTGFSISKAYSAIRDSIWEIILPFIILGGIYGGIFTVTEAAAITAFYVIIVEVFIYRDINLFRDLSRIMRESMLLIGTIIIILGTAMGLTGYLIDQEIPMKLLDIMRLYITSKFAFLILLNIFLLIVGCMMDIFSAIIVVVPLIIPIAMNFGVDMIHLGIIFLANLEIGYSTPPVGINLFISSSRFQQPVIKLYKAALPFLMIHLIGLIIITYFPWVSLFLVRLFTDG